MSSGESVSSQRDGEAAPYLNDARYHVVLLLQKRVLMGQLNKLDQYVSESLDVVHGYTKHSLYTIISDSSHRTDSKSTKPNIPATRGCI